MEIRDTSVLFYTHQMTDGFFTSCGVKLVINCRRLVWETTTTLGLLDLREFAPAEKYIIRSPSQHPTLTDCPFRRRPNTIVHRVVNWWMSSLGCSWYPFKDYLTATPPPPPPRSCLATATHTLKWVYKGIIEFVKFGCKQSLCCWSNVDLIV